MKRIVICADGTWNVPDHKDRGEVRPSNVAKIAETISVAGAQGTEQIIRYHKGIGTGRDDRILGGAFGVGLSQHVKDAYQSVVEQYEPGDEIYLFGFSRGAFTIRSTAGLIRNSGVLRRENEGKLDDAYRLHRSRDDKAHPNGIEAKIFRKEYSYEVRIKMIGVWETVGALGIPGIPWLPATFSFLNKRWAFHDTQLSSIVDTAYQALAIDERRFHFAPTLWTPQPDQKEQNPHQIVEQVWFAGAHANVGGGYADSGLSDLAFLWMVQKAEAGGLTFDQQELAQNVRMNVLGELRNSRIGLYRLFPEYIRPIGRVYTEDIDPSALQRRAEAQDPVYHPPNFEAYLRGKQV